MQFNSKNRYPGLVSLSALLLAGCAAPAPPLPVDTTSVNRTQSITLSAFATDDAALSCEEIATERQDIDKQMRAANARIEGNRTQNQVAGYLGALLVVPLVATESNQAERGQIAKLYARQDILIKLAAAKDCKGRQ